MVKRKKTTVKKVAEATAKSDTVQLADILKDSDGALLILDKGGHIVVHDLKGVRNAIYAKGMLQSALDSYLIRPIITTVNDLHRSVTATIHQLKAPQK